MGQTKKSTNPPMLDSLFLAYSLTKDHGFTFIHNKWFYLQLYVEFKILKIYVSHWKQ